MNTLPNEVLWVDGELPLFLPGAKWWADPNCVGLYCMEIPASAEPFCIRLDRKLERWAAQKEQAERQGDYGDQLTPELTAERQMRAHAVNEELRKRHGRRRRYSPDFSQELPLGSPYLAEITDKIRPHSEYWWSRFPSVRIWQRALEDPDMMEEVLRGEWD